MDETAVKIRNQESSADEAHVACAPERTPDWETPRMEDVSEQVTAQPYIRFT